ncbi:Anaphase-promoting complex, cyclosome, subunit 3, partial [Candidatus Electrothrix marina]
GVWDEAEEWLREAAERSPNHEPSRVELARLLINRGEEHWDEAEHWLREAAERNPDHGQSHLVWASLLAKRNKRAEAIDLLEGFIARTGGNLHVAGFLERLRAGQTPETDEAAEDTGLPPEIEAEHSKANTVSAPVSALEEETVPDSSDAASTGITSLERIMEDIQHRASLQAQFMRTLSGTEDTDTCDNLRQLSEQGDTLAGFFQQWLNKDFALEIPPNAWAWRASRLYQQGTEEEWQQLEQECADKTPYTRFLRLQAEEEPNDNLLQQVNNWIDRQEEDRYVRPLDRYIVSAHRQLLSSSPDHSKRNAVVFAVCNAAAADAPEIS